MDNQEAKFILQAYRPSGSDAAAPEMQEALAQARRDPSLGKWFENECAIDSAIANKLKTCPVPEGLRASILAGAKLTRSMPWWRQTWVLAAACVALLLTLAGLYYPRAVPPGLGLESFAANYTANGIYLQNETPDLAKIRSWLAVKGVELPQQLPQKLTELEGMGCRSIEYDGVKVALICFYKGDKGYHLFMAKKADMPGGEFPDNLRISSQAKGWNTAAWSDSTHRYVLVTDASRDELASYL